MYQQIWNGQRNKILSAVESLTGHCYLLADPFDDESPELVSEFLEALYGEGLRQFRAELRREVNMDYISEMWYRMSRLRYWLPLYKENGEVPTIEEMRNYIHGKPSGLCRIPRKKPDWV